MSTPTHHTNILILGGGFGGVYTALFLEKMMRHSELEQISITLVNRENYIVFQPLLPEVISGTIGLLNAISPIRRLAKRTNLITREVEQIDLENKTVLLAPGFRPKPMVLNYDHLIIGLGTQLDYSRIPGMKEHTVPFKYLGDALYLRNHLVHVLEEASLVDSEAERKRLLTFVVAGGGFSGVECMAEMNDIVRRAIRVYPRLDPKDLRLVLLQSADRILPEMDSKLGKYAQRVLERRGVEVQLQTRLKSASAHAATIFEKQSDTEQVLPTDTIVTTVPAGPHALIRSLSCQLERDRIKVNEYLEVEDFSNVWAVGDCAAVPQSDGIVSPPTAQHAVRQAKTCATNVLAAYRNTTAQKFTFTGLGKLGSLGPYCAVAEVFGMKLSGFLAWLLWRAVYLSKFPGLDRKLRVLSDWALDLCLPKDLTQIRIFKRDQVLKEHFEPGDYVIHQGDFGDKIYFVVNGTLNVERDGHVINDLMPGATFGEVALISGDSRTASVRAVTAVDVVSVSRSAFQQILQHVPGIRKEMEMIMSQHLQRDVDLEKESHSGQGSP